MAQKVTTTPAAGANALSPANDDSGVTMERLIPVTEAEIVKLIDKFEEAEWCNCTAIQAWMLADDMVDVLRRIIGREHVPVVA